MNKESEKSKGSGEQKVRKLNEAGYNPPPPEKDQAIPSEPTPPPPKKDK